MRSRIGRKCELVFFRRIAQFVQYNSRLHHRHPPCWINLQNLRHVLGKIQNDRDIAALTGKRRPATSAQQGCAKLARRRDGGNHIVIISGKYDTDWDLPVVGSIRCVKRAAAIVEADFALHPAAQRGRQPISIYFCGLGGTCQLCEVLQA